MKKEKANWEAVKKAGLEIHYGQDLGFDGESRGCYIGKSWCEIGDDETGKQFKDAVEAAVKELVGEVEGEFGTIEEAYYNG